VIDTVGIKVGPFAMVDQFGTPHTEVLPSWNATGCSTTNLRTNPRTGAKEKIFAFSSPIRSRAPPGLGLLEFTVENPGVFTTLVSPPGSVLALAPDGSLWASTEFGLAWRDKDRHWQTYTRASTKGRSGRDFPKAALTPPPNSRSLCASVEA
jgi:hypothetical protein